MAMNNPYKQYQQNSVTIATPEELTLMLYNGAIKFTKLAKMNIEEKNIEETNINLVKAQNIISELNGTLNMKYDVAKDLRSLYVFIKEKLIDANLKKKTEIIDEIIPIMEDMRDTWKEAMALAKEEKLNSPKAVEAN